MKDFSSALRILPQSPGVYLMKDIQGTIIYVGKAKNLKNRVTSYFRGFDAHPPKTQTLVVNIDEFEYILTDTEVEALILEDNLIKQYMPRFNIRLKDDKTYPYIKITNEPFPRVIKVREVKRDRARYFGPYTSDFDVNQTLDVIKKVFPIRQCQRDLTKKQQRPCLNYHIKQCLGPCKGNIHQDQYAAIIDEISLFLSGKEHELIGQMEQQMQEKAEALKFEEAMVIRDQLQSLKHLSIKQKITHANGIDQDVVGLFSEADKACGMVFFVRNGILLGRESFMFDDVEAISSEELLRHFLMQFYGGTAFIPKEIILPAALEDEAVFEDWFSQKLGKKVRIIVPKQGEKKRLVEMVNTNAKEYLEKHFETVIAKERHALEKVHILQNLLDLPNPLKRIEAYDISNIMGVFSVGSMVVYENGLKKKSDYRRFKVKTIEGPNDYGSMMEVVYRRFNRAKSDTAQERGFDKYPDVLLIDGGKGHVSVVEDVLKAFNLDIPVVGMVKNDRHKTAGLYYCGREYPLKTHDELYSWLGSIQEEVHRFAISYHRSLRDQTMSQSVLDEIAGVGIVTRKQLLLAFGGIESIKNADVATLVEKGRIKHAVAESIYNFFHKVEDTTI